MLTFRIGLICIISLILEEIMITYFACPSLDRVQPVIIVMGLFASTSVVT
jgi:hypothetical protein